MAGNVLLVEDEPSVGELVRGYLDRDELLPEVRRRAKRQRATRGK